MSKHLKLRNSFCLTALVICGLTLGCARDNSRNLVSDFFEPPSSQIDKIEMQPETAQAADSSAPTIQRTSYEAQIADPKWLTSLPQAISQAQSESKLILIDFTGSDWCHFCVKLKQEVFETSEFKAWAGDNVVLLEVDFPKRSPLPPEVQQQNEMLKTRYSIKSYPTVLLVDVEGNVKAQMGYQNGQSPAQWVQVAESKLHQATGAGRVAGRPQGSMTR